MELCVGIESSLVPGFREPGVVEDTADRPLAAPSRSSPGVLEARVGSPVPTERIVPSLAKQEVVSSLSGEAVVALAAVHAVSATSTAEEVVPPEALDRVCSTQTNDDVVAGGSSKHVRSHGARERGGLSKAGLDRSSQGARLPDKNPHENRGGQHKHCPS